MLVVAKRAYRTTLVASIEEALPLHVLMPSPPDTRHVQRVHQLLGLAKTRDCSSRSRSSHR